MKDKVAGIPEETMSEKGLTSRMPQFNSALAHQQNKPESHIGAKAPEGVLGTTEQDQRSINDTIPEQTCGECRHFNRCAGLIYTLRPESTECDWFPSRFDPASSLDRVEGER